jgi:hypothetical protein
MTQRRNEHGGAMMVTLIIIVVLLAGASMLVSVSVNSTRSTGMTRTGLTATYCAEAGLTAARQVVANGQVNWAGGAAGSLCTDPDHDACVEPTWIQTGFVHDLDGDGDVDVKILLIDNDDELPTPNNAADNDRKVFIVSKCLTFPDTQRELTELVEVAGGETNYADKEGGATGGGVATQ